MRGRSSSKQGRSGRGGGGSMDIDKVDKLKEEPQLSGAYIRSLVKQLTSSRSKDGDADGLKKNLSKTGDSCISDDHTQNSQQQPTQPPQHKKQVRRRLHTSRPYQERLLNMAEARREIVTALKFHRASMKQQETNNNHDHQSQIHPQPVHPPPHPPLGQGGKPKSRRNPRIYASTTTVPSAPAANFSNNYLEPYSALSCAPPLPYFWPLSAVAPPPPPLIPESLNLTLPNQPLGLNLNFQDFNDIHTTLYHNPSLMYSLSTSSSPSTSSSATLSAATEEMVPLSEDAGANSSGRIMNGEGLEGGDVGGGLHQAMDYEEIEEIRSMGEQHQMEWNDTLNLVTSARWFKFLKTMEIGPDEKIAAAHEDDDDGYGYHPFDEVMEFPPWLVNANESCWLQQHLDDQFPDEYLQDPALPCMEIGEIEGMDGDWLA